MNDRLEGPDGNRGTGLRAAEAAAMAERWWGEVGRSGAWRRFNEEQIGRKVRTSSGAGPGFVIQGDREQVVPSGILQGVAWQYLSSDERLAIVKAWYHEIWLPEQRAEKAKPIDPQAGPQKVKAEKLQ